jgi:hypothetical protein
VLTAGLLAAAFAPVAAVTPMTGTALAASATATAATTASVASSPAAALAAAGCKSPSGAVSCSPRVLTPALPVKTSKTFQIRHITQCGSRMYAVGTFSQIVSPNKTGSGSVTYSRNNVFSFQAAWPYRVTSWNPNVNGAVDSIAVGGTNCANAYLGGTFTKVHGKTVHNLAEVSTSTGAVRTRFRSNASATVATLLLHGGRLLTGGYFTSINGQSRRYYVGLNPTTGVPDAYLGLSISGNYKYSGVVPNPTRVWNQQLSHDGKRLLVEGDFTSVGGKPRQQIFMLALGASHATVTGWTSAAFSYHCSVDEPFYIQSAAWGPNDGVVYIATTGYHPLGGPTGDHDTRTGLCDAAVKFPATEKKVTREWINYAGCDSLYSVAASSTTVYVAGHERWANNGNACDAQGAGAVKAPGLAGLSTTTGKLRFNPTRSRGLGADQLLLTKAGLWIASDNLSGTANGKPYTSAMCGGEGPGSKTPHDLAGLCFLPN